jgi:predicted TIM-barrel fold metal-dependent hydrolase
MANETGAPYIVVSTDSHASPLMEEQLRPYCPAKYLDLFDEAVAGWRQQVRDQEAMLHPERRRSSSGIGSDADPNISPLAKEAFARVKRCRGLIDATARLEDMDEQGIGADVIFPGGQNLNELPFMGFGVDAGNPAISTELRMVGAHIWNEWIADFTSEAPERLIGVVQVPIYDIDAAIKELHWGIEHGLRAVNFPAPRRDLVPYFDPMYEPLWSAVEEAGLPLVTHTGGGEPPIGWPGPAPGAWILWAEIDWFGRRGLWHMMFGGVFERHPRLKMVFTEQHVSWVRSTLADLDSIWKNDILSGIEEFAPRPPSEYWAENCFVAGSFMAHYEVEELDAVGGKNLMWGSDYPHVEGTWPNTRLSLRKTFAGFPESVVRAVIGENALGVYNLDREALAAVAEKIGPTVEELSVPLAPDEFPALRGGAFREIGVIA